MSYWQVQPTNPSLPFYLLVGSSAALFAAGWLYLFWSVRDPPELEDEGEDENGLTGNAGQEAEVCPG